MTAPATGRERRLILDGKSDAKIYWADWPFKTIQEVGRKMSVSGTAAGGKPKCCLSERPGATAPNALRLAMRFTPRALGSALDSQRLRFWATFV